MYVLEKNLILSKNFKFQIIKKLKILKNDFVKNFLTLFTGSVIAQALMLAITPVITRLYSEEMFGLYIIFASIIVVLQIITTLRFELAIVLPKDDADAINILAITIIINLIISSLLFAIILLFFDFINNLLGSDNLGYYLYLVPISTSLTGFYHTFRYWSNRKKEYKNISTSLIAKNVAVGSWNIGFGFANMKAIGLIPGQIAGLFVSTGLLIILSIKEILPLLKYLSLKKMIFLLKKYKDIIRFNTLINLLVNISNEAPIFLLLGFFGKSTVGLYGMANKLIGTPSDMISRSVGQVFFQKASEVYNNKQDIYSFLKKTYLNLLKIAAVIFVPAFLISPFLKYILGTTYDWTATGYFAMMIIPLLFLKFLNNPVSSIFTILNEQKKLTVYYIIILFLRVASIYVGYYFFNSAYVAIGLFVFSGIIFNIILIILFLQMAKKHSNGFKNTNK